MRPLILAALSLALLAAAPAAPVAVETAGGPDEAVPVALRPAVAEAGVRISLDGRPAMILWPVRELPSAGAAGGYGRAFPELPKGGLVGVVEVLARWSDYRGDAVEPGAYTLRYLVEPADGAHMGVSVYRDFLLFVPAADDPGPAAVLGFDELVGLSRRASASHHPAVLALFPVPAEASPPATAENELGQPMAVIAVGGTNLGLVMEGQGER